MPKNWKCITPPDQSFAGLPVCTQLDDLEADIALIGLHYVSPYPQRLPETPARTMVETAADAIRRQSSVFIDHLDHYDFDFIGAHGDRYCAALQDRADGGSDIFRVLSAAVQLAVYIPAIDHADLPIG